MPPCCVSNPEHCCTNDSLQPSLPLGLSFQGLSFNADYSELAKAHGHASCKAICASKAGLQDAHPRMRPAHEAVPLRPVIAPGPKARAALPAAAEQVCTAVPLRQPSIRALRSLAAVLCRVLLAVLCTDHNALSLTMSIELAEGLLCDTARPKAKVTLYAVSEALESG